VPLTRSRQFQFAERQKEGKEKGTKKEEKKKKKEKRKVFISVQSGEVRNSNHELVERTGGYL